MFYLSNIKKIKVNHYYLGAFIFLSINAFSQSYVEPDKLKSFNITVNYDDYTVKTQMLSQVKKINVNNELTYLWYASQKIIETKGGYEGKLIHGKYTSFYLNNQLREKGLVKFGLKHKEWKYWYPDGKLKEIINWRNGKKSGVYLLYNDYGKLMAKSRFKNDKLHGKFYTYSANGVVTDKRRYKNGEEVVRKVKVKKEPKVKDNNTEPKPAKKEKRKKDHTPKQPSDSTSTVKKESFFKRIFKKKEQQKKQEEPAPTQAEKQV